MLQEIRSFNKNDILVHADPSKTFEFESLLIEPFAPGQPIWKMIKETEKNLKESGVNTLCLAEVYLINDEKEIRTPLMLTPLTYSIDKLRGQLKLEKIEEAIFVNPYVDYLLDSNDIEKETEIQNVATLLQNAGFKLDMEAAPCIGNFHHHRYAILRELEQLIEQDEFSTPLASLLGEGKEQASQLNLPPNILLPADIDHALVFDKANETSAVIQGPPGTGKSQVLTNLIGKLLGANKSSIALSEKRVALEVLMQKLSEFGLDRLGFIVTSDNASKELLKQLEENWHYFEQEKFDTTPNLRLSEQYTSQLQFSLDLLNQPDAIGGVSLYDFKAWMESLSRQTNEYVGTPPSITSIHEHESLLQEIYAKGLQTSIAFIKPNTLNRYDFEVLHETFAEFGTKLKALKNKFEYATWGEFIDLIRKAYLAQSKENYERKKYTDLFRRNSRKQKRFLKLHSQWIVANAELEQVQSKGRHIRWKKQPTRVDIATLQAQRNKDGFLSQRRFYRLWKQYSDEPTIAYEQIKYLTDLYTKEDVVSQLIVDFCELGIENPRKEVDLLHHSVTVHEGTEWEILDELTNDQLDYLTKSHQFLGDALRELDKMLFLEESTPILDTLDAIIGQFSELVALLPKIKKMDSEAIQLLGIASELNSYKAITANSHWSQFRQRFPSFSEFQMSDLHTKSDDIVRSENSESQQFATAILREVQQRFQSYQELLNTPARKLSEEDKERKKRLRKGKSILVKEFAKTRRHPTVRELFASEAREWIQLLMPIWFSNPTQVSKVFPLEQDLFDVAIFDEASQIPLQNGLGALQRANRGIIAGDSEQMGPTSYFKSGSSEVVDLLHQASFHWSSNTLKHHYRSLHPELIAFSNQHFYKGELKAYPAFGIEAPLHHHFVSDGVFEDRKNIPEAKAIAKVISQALGSKESIGIVAFSEEQLSCIHKQLSEKDVLLLNDRLEDGTAFFKALEKVQGDECDHLIISFGYGKDTEGNFAMRFGPMNTENGRRRLNVLLTRARKRLDFFSSVTYDDFKLSDNESIDLLRLWFAKAQFTGANETGIQLPFDADFSVDKNVITLRKPHKHFEQAREFVTFQSVMEARGWKIQYA